MTKLNKNGSPPLTSGTISAQQEAFNEHWNPRDLERWQSNITNDPVMRFSSDRRLKVGLEKLCNSIDLELADILHWNVLIVCGGTGGEGMLLSRLGFKSVTVSDISENGLEICNSLAPHIHTLQLNAEAMDLKNDTYDLVVVQAGLHHLPRPTLGLTEMLRVARKAVIVLEPHTGVVPDLIGTVWEEQGDARNYVFRWNHEMFEQITRSYTLSDTILVKGYKDWEHGQILRKVASKFPSNMQLGLMKTIYYILNTIFPMFANKFIGIVVIDKNP